MAGETNTGLVNHISNPIVCFPENSITIDIFGNVFYRDYKFGAGDDTGVYWNSEKKYSKGTMIFLSTAMKASLKGRFSYGHKLRSSKSHDLTMNLPIQPDGSIDFAFMDNLIAELQAERIAELQAYLTATGLKDYTLTEEEKSALKKYETQMFKDFDVTELFDVKNSHNILSEDIVEDSGDTPYLCASTADNAVSSYIKYDENLKDEGNCIFIGGKTFVVTYQKTDFYSNDSHNLILYLKEATQRTRLKQLYVATCVNRSLSHKYSWGDSISKAKIRKDKIALPTKNGKPDFNVMETLISAIQKLVIKEVVMYADKKIAGTKTVVGQ